MTAIYSIPYNICSFQFLLLIPICYSFSVSSLHLFFFLFHSFFRSFLCRVIMFIRSFISSTLFHFVRLMVQFISLSFSLIFLQPLFFGRLVPYYTFPPLSNLFVTLSETRLLFFLLFLFLLFFAY